MRSIHSGQRCVLLHLALAIAATQHTARAQASSCTNASATLVPARQQTCKPLQACFSTTAAAESFAQACAPQPGACAASNTPGLAAITAVAIARTPAQRTCLHLVPSAQNCQEGSGVVRVLDAQAGCELGRAPVVMDRTPPVLRRWALAVDLANGTLHVQLHVRCHQTHACMMLVGGTRASSLSQHTARSIAILADMNLCTYSQSRLQDWYQQHERACRCATRTRLTQCRCLTHTLQRAET